MQMEISLENMGNIFTMWRKNRLYIWKKPYLLNSKLELELEKVYLT